MSVRQSTPRWAVGVGLACAALVVAGCSSATESSGSGSDEPGKDTPAVGFITVGPKDDFGYNQAVYEGSQAVEDAFPDLEVMLAENVPEDDSAATTMQRMIDDGAKLIFATSYGHLDAALKVAEENPDVVVVQQGNTITTDIPENSGTYFGTVYEPMYLAGIAAGAATESDKLGYVYAFPIPQTIANINAFERGAQSVNPDVETITVSTSSWCDPGKQQAAAESLLAEGVDVLTQHQDCTSTVIQAAEKAGAMTVGYHADASELAPEGWLTGAVWDWGPVYTDIVQTVVDGDFVGSGYNDNFRVGYKTGTNPFVLAPYGPGVSEETIAAIEDAQAWLGTEEGSPFAGPVLDQDGEVEIEEGVIPTYAENDAMDFFVQGVVGNLAQ
ncbi:BMP family ABC transporter substrate-binding protein [Nocardioides stalactiti]|uniref:BMP family ABC transporter substrate-binding protein n=1 Tax=Nocardioides stalactiti TaxID=2755356 RepID=UPI0016018610|nr:BMP family ABC transporter substrate-binding protein [Nocardioides stalactiti]